MQRKLFQVNPTFGNQSKKQSRQMSGRSRSTDASGNRTEINRLRPYQIEERIVSGKLGGQGLFKLSKDAYPLQAKLNNLQNRLGFVASLAKQVSKRPTSTSEGRERALEELGNLLEESRLVREDTFVKRVNTDVEREWLRKNRSEEAKHWNLLTNWRPEHLQYVL